jgi:DNA-binding NtrC family response regulator
MKKSILICDDEEGIRESLKLILEKDYDLSFAHDGNEAISMLKKSPADMVIIDIKMPRMDGIETMKKLRHIKSDIKMLVTSGYKSVETAQDAVAAGAIDYITKPFERAEILKAVRKLSGQ